eukprot:3368166-Rhodomonas_salina.6
MPPKPVRRVSESESRIQREGQRKAVQRAQTETEQSAQRQPECARESNTRNTRDAYCTAPLRLL